MNSVVIETAIVAIEERHIKENKAEISVAKEDYVATIKIPK